MNTTKDIKVVIRDFVQSQDGIMPETQNQYRVVLNQLVNYSKRNNILLRTATKQDIIKWKQFLQDNYKARTIENYIIIVRKFYQFMSDMGYCQDITKGIKLPRRRYSRTVRRSLTPDQSRQLLSSIRKQGIINKRNYAIVLLMLSNALRTVEVSRLSMRDMEESRINIHGKGQLPSEKEWIKIEEPVFQAIQDYLLSAQIDLSDSSPLFVSLGNRSMYKRINPDGIGMIIKKLLLNIGLKDDYTAHSLRHTAAVMALDKGLSLEQIRVFLRHESIRTTQIYLSSITDQIKLENKASSVIVKELLM